MARTGESEQREQPVLHHVRAGDAPGWAVHHLGARWVAGMEMVDKIKRGAGGKGIVQGPDRMVKARIASDAAG